MAAKKKKWEHISYIYHKERLPWTPPLSKKLLKLNVELLEARYCINLCNDLRKLKTYKYCWKYLYTSFPYASRWWTVSKDLYTTIQLALWVRSTNKLASCGMDTFGSFVQCTRSEKKGIIIHFWFMIEQYVIHRKNYNRDVLLTSVKIKIVINLCTILSWPNLLSC